MNELINNFQDQSPFRDEEFESKLKMFFSPGFRRTGRTRLMAKVLLELALETQHRVYLTDHTLLEQNYNFDRNCRSMKNELQAVNDFYKYQHFIDIELNFNFSNGTAYFVASFKNEKSYKNFLKMRIKAEWSNVRPKSRLPNKKMLLLI